MEAVNLPPPFHGLLRDFLEPIAPDPVTYGVIRSLSDENLRAQALAPVLSSDPAYVRYLLAQSFLAERMAEWAAENGEKNAPLGYSVLLERILGLLGKAPIRNLIACARQDRLAKLPAKPENPDDKVSVTPSKELPFALAAETLCQDKGWIHPERAFDAGLHYDWLAALLSARKGPPDEKTALASAFKEGLLLAKTAYCLGQALPDMRLGADLFSAGLLAPLGKVVMACLYPASANPSWAAFAKECDAAGNHQLDHYAFREHRKFPVTHPQLSALLVSFGAVSRGVDKAVAFYLWPEALRHSGADIFQLASALSVAARMARHGDKQIPLESFHERWLLANGITADALKQAAQSALQS